MTRVTYTFEEVTIRREKNLPCPVCGKKAKRARTFMNTINPYNVDPETKVSRTRRQVRECLEIEAAAWQPVPEAHSKCISEREAGS